MSKITPSDVAGILAEVREDPSLISTINVDELLSSIENAKNDFLENETSETIAQNVFDSIKQLRISREILADHFKKLAGYRLVDELHLLHKGKYVRWIRLDKPTILNVGGIVVDIKFTNNGTIVLCRLTSGRFIQYRFDQCITFQKLTDEESLILMIYDKV